MLVSFSRLTKRRYFQACLEDARNFYKPQVLTIFLVSPSTQRKLNVKVKLKNVIKMGFIS